ncbi:cytochrome-c oxidase, cbb3-type subunit II [uncultured Microbulbifer sp.]|uniref:cytochrome-c oxidase, cbb3-type subunit II n=1 Tax=uncultured Microbulbifer sp. TaxID=348147 RepID=UPI00261D89BB|nr:cytochrome-c oxidase, cbb3-type subunit II [uncultured Microbulbifer sp.]
MLTKEFTQSVWILILSVIAVASLSLLAWVLPNLFTKSELVKNSTAKPFTALQLAGRDIYISEGCANCHSQMVRPLAAEVARYGRFTTAEDDIYEYPNLWGSKRTGPDLANLGRKYSYQWHEAHLRDPRAVVPTSIMPAYPWLFEKRLSGERIGRKMEVLRSLGVPYTDAEIDRARLEVRNKTYAQALIAYLQSLGE